MKKFILMLILFVLSMPIMVHAKQEVKAPEQIQDELFQQFDFSEVDQMLEDVFPREKLTFGDTILKLISGDITFSFELIKELFLDQFTYELQHSKSGLIHVLLIVIVAAIFTNFSSVFKSTQVSEISFSMLYMLLLTICLTNFRVLVESTSLRMGQLMEFMKILSPTYFFAVAMATGSGTSMVFYQLILLLILILEMVIQNFLIPLTQIYMVIRILGELSPEIPLTKFADFIYTIVSWSLKTILAGVIGMNLISSLLMPAIDSVKRSVLIKSGEAIPIIGDVIGGATEIVLGTAVLIKNGIGVAGMIICLIICLAPMIQMAVTALLYQLVSALIQPISDKRLVNCVSSLAEGSKLLLNIMFSSGVLFLVTIAMVATTTGG